MAPDTDTRKQRQTLEESIRILYLSIDSKELLSRLYMPAIMHGGLFIPSNDRLPEMGSCVLIILSLPEFEGSLAVLGRVIWLNANPAPTPGTAKRGYGVQFAIESSEPQSSIDALLADYSQPGCDNLAHAIGKGKHANQTFTF